MTAWIVDEELAQGDARRARVLPSPLVGRKRQLELLITTFDGIRGERMPHLVTIVGDAGWAVEAAARVRGARGSRCEGGRRSLPSLWRRSDPVAAGGDPGGEAGVRDNDPPDGVLKDPSPCRGGDAIRTGTDHARAPPRWPRPSATASPGSIRTRTIAP